MKKTILATALILATGIAQASDDAVCRELGRGGRTLIITDLLLVSEGEKTPITVTVLDRNENVVLESDLVATQNDVEVTAKNRRDRVSLTFFWDEPNQTVLYVGGKTLYFDCNDEE